MSQPSPLSQMAGADRILTATAHAVADQLDGMAQGNLESALARAEASADAVCCRLAAAMFRLSSIVGGVVEAVEKEAADAMASLSENLLATPESAAVMAAVPLLGVAAPTQPGYPDLTDDRVKHLMDHGAVEVEEEAPLAEAVCVCSSADGTVYGCPACQLSEDQLKAEEATVGGPLPVPEYLEAERRAALEAEEAEAIRWQADPKNGCEVIEPPLAEAARNALADAARPSDKACVLDRTPEEEAARAAERAKVNALADAVAEQVSTAANAPTTERTLMHCPECKKESQASLHLGLPLCPVCLIGGKRKRVELVEGPAPRPEAKAKARGPRRAKARAKK